ncbi:hypothetical protein [Luteipulveratus flavus]|uniref:Uncharacterized protein n=1 Tax=Luteipulveratus flavus TaxID=3031728 RepID=A0ABT6C2Q2_9MICO|nr:hypothetical protein [Luteipulveratus sp. YIM 133296]MDF8262965.1 hypothetical protein [Luteipulveratus sp. YIM 133296]
MPDPAVPTYAVAPALLRDVLPRVESAYVLGLPSPEVLKLVAERSRATTLLLAWDDKEPAELPESVTLEHADLRDLAGRADARRPLVLAPRGLDVLLPAGDPTPWADRLDLVAALTTTGGTLLTYCRNDAPLGALGRGGIDWTPADEDPTRPVAASDLGAALARVGHPVTTVHLLYGVASRTAAAVSDTCAARTRAGSLPAQVVEHVAAADPAPTSVPASQLVTTAVRTRQLSQLADGWLTLSGGRGRDLYWTVDGAVVWADQEAAGADWVLGGDATAAAVLPQRVPDSDTVERHLLQQVARGDLETFRRTAERLGHWVRSSADPGETRELRWDEVRLVGTEFSRGIALRTELVGEVPETPGSDEDTDREPHGAIAPTTSERRLAGAWARFAERVEGSTDGMWPTLFDRHELTSLWLSMSGVSPEAVALMATSTTEPDEDAAVGAGRATALADRIALLTETLDARDEQLRVREARIRSLRAQALGASRNRDKALRRLSELRGSRTYRLANQFRRASLLARPRVLAKGVARRAESKVRAVRRMR